VFELIILNKILVLAFVIIVSEIHVVCVPSYYSSFCTIVNLDIYLHI